MSNIQQVTSGAGRHQDTGLHCSYGKATLARTAEMCHKSKMAGDKASFLPGLLHTHGPEPPLVAGVSNICSRFLAVTGTSMDHIGSGVLSWIAHVYQDLTFLRAAVMPHLFLVLERLLSQLRVRRKRVPKHYSSLCPRDSLHPSFATVQGLYRTTGRAGLHGMPAASGEVSPQHVAFLQMSPQNSCTRQRSKSKALI